MFRKLIDRLMVALIRVNTKPTYLEVAGLVPWLAREAAIIASVSQQASTAFV